MKHVELEVVHAGNEKQACRINLVDSDDPTFNYRGIDVVTDHYPSLPTRLQDTVDSINREVIYHSGIQSLEIVSGDGPVKVLYVKCRWVDHCRDQRWVLPVGAEVKSAA